MAISTENSFKRVFNLLKKAGLIVNPMRAHWLYEDLAAAMIENPEYSCADAEIEFLLGQKNGASAQDVDKIVSLATNVAYHPELIGYTFHTIMKRYPKSTSSFLTQLHKKMKDANINCQRNPTLPDFFKVLISFMLEKQLDDSCINLFNPGSFFTANQEHSSIHSAIEGHLKVLDTQRGLTGRAQLSQRWHKILQPDQSSSPSPSPKPLNQKRWWWNSPKSGSHVPPASPVPPLRRANSLVMNQRATSSDARMQGASFPEMPRSHSTSKSTGDYHPHRKSTSVIFAYRPIDQLQQSSPISNHRKSRSMQRARQLYQNKPNEDSSDSSDSD